MNGWTNGWTDAQIEERTNFPYDLQNIVPFEAGAQKGRDEGRKREKKEGTERTKSETGKEREGKIGRNILCYLYEAKT